MLESSRVEGLIPSWELTCPHPRHVFSDDFPFFSRVGYVSSLEGSPLYIIRIPINLPIK